MSAEFPWEGWYHKEHDAFCKVESRNYVLEKALREIVGLMPSEWGHHDEPHLMEIDRIARKVLGEE